MIVALLGSTANAQPLPVGDMRRLSGDTQIIAQCLAVDEAGYSCVRSVQAACYKETPPDLASAATDRSCAFRALAAWTVRLDDLLARLKAITPDPAALDESQSAWEAMMLADVGLESALYQGGSLMRIVAVNAHAEATALRALRLRTLLTALDPPP